ncbi:type II toxin-antitoxin system PemK/MazF family toxin [Mesorhizobium xinjiangense]|uniref:type II toxin-antitoxin system PemK/MazF family toxin n=1 Tax=Mesorhizobium xinjiangense TaxID=2678685 RepID=UPI0012ED9B42|nr:type II toxin-antitoxin system PemK/MazF family toxin [Mesorhizobium xinjiangense]
MTSLEAGDIVWVDFDPVLGTEQAGRRPAIVVTDREYNTLYPRSIVCPITRNSTPWPTKVLLPSGMTTRGAVLADQPRTVHRSLRVFRFIERAPEGILADVRAIIGSLIGLDRI